MKASMRQFGWLMAAVVILLAACAPAATQAPAPTATTAATPKPQSAAGGGLQEFSVQPPTPTPVVIKLEGATTTSTGLQYLEEKAGTGELPKKGELITMHYIASLADGTELFNSYTQGSPVTTVWGTNQLLPGWEEGIGMMKVGTKAKLVLPPALAFGEQGSGSIPPNTQIVLVVELLKTSTAPVPSDVAEDKLTKSESGLQYYDLKTGDGAEAVKNSKVATNYTLWVKTDTGYNFVDSSTYSKPAEFTVGKNDYVFPGWDEGAQGMKVGGKRYLVIPPALGIGNNGGSAIPANSTLVMEIELVSATEPRLPVKVDETKYTKTDSGLRFYDILEAKNGKTPTKGQTLVVNYTGWLEDGTIFDSSVDSGQPFSFVLGEGNVIAGWDEGVATMKVGSTRQLIIPAELAYGAQGAGSAIPPNATLIFEIELLEIK